MTSEVDRCILKLIFKIKGKNRKIYDIFCTQKKMHLDFTATKKTQNFHLGSNLNHTLNQISLSSSLDHFFVTNS